MSDYRFLLKNKSFVFLWISQILSQLSINIMNFLLLTRLFALTSSGIATSFLWVSYSLPAILVGPLASAVVDVADRRKILIITNFLQFLTIFIYAFVFEYRVFLIYGVAMAYSLLNQFYVPSESASLPSLVERRSLPEANSLFFITQQFSLVLGFGIAGLLSKLLGFKNTLMLCSSFLFLAAVSVSFLPRMKFGGVSFERFDELLFAFFGRIKDGYDFIIKNRRVLFPFLLLLSMQIGLAIIMVNIPLFAEGILRVHSEKGGLLIVVPAGIGAAIGALVVPKILKKRARKKTIIEYSLFSISLCLFLLSFLFVLFSELWLIFLSFVIIIVLGLSFVGVVIPTQTFLQSVVPGGLRGRIFGNFWFLVTIATIFPVMFSGALSEFLGVRFLILILASICFTGYILAKRKGDLLINDG